MIAPHHNCSCSETLNLLDVSSCENASLLHFVMSCMEQNKKHKQTLESAQYGLEKKEKDM